MPCAGRRPAGVRPRRTGPSWRTPPPAPAPPRAAPASAARPGRAAPRRGTPARWPSRTSTACRTGRSGRRRAPSLRTAGCRGSGGPAGGRRSPARRASGPPRSSSPVSCRRSAMVASSSPARESLVCGGDLHLPARFEGDPAAVRQRGLRAVRHQTARGVLAQRRAEDPRDPPAAPDRPGGAWSTRARSPPAPAAPS